MKHIILVILLAISIYPQSSKFFTLSVLASDEGYKNVETTLYLTDQTVSKEQATRIDAFVTMLKDSLQITSLSSKFDVMYLLANETSALGLRNLVKRSHDATIGAATVTFTQWEGFVGDGIAGFIHTHYNPLTNGINVTQNSNSMAIYCRTDNFPAQMRDIGITTTGEWQIVLRWTNTTYNYFNNTTLSVAIGSSTGMHINTRTSNVQCDSYRNNVNIITNGASASSAFNDGVVCIGAVGAGTLDNDPIPNSFTTRQYSFAFLGGGLSAIESRKITNCIESYLDDLGTGVIP